MGFCRPPEDDSKPEYASEGVGVSAVVGEAMVPQERLPGVCPAASSPLIMTGRCC